jgi:hypothetical protein
MSLIDGAKKDLLAREMVDAERRQRMEDERKAQELQASVLLKMAAERVCHLPSYLLFPSSLVSLSALLLLPSAFLYITTDHPFSSPFFNRQWQV